MCSLENGLKLLMYTGRPTPKRIEQENGLGTLKIFCPGKYLGATGNFSKRKLIKTANQFLSHKINFVTLCYRHFSQKNFFFLETKKFSVFYVFWTQAIILQKVVRRPASGVRRPADKTFTKKNFDFK